MTKVTFTAGGVHRTGYSGLYSFADGQTREIEDGEAKRLCRTWPENFSIVADEPEKKPDTEKSFDPDETPNPAPPSNKAIRGRRKK